MTTGPLAYNPRDLYALTGLTPLPVQLGDGRLRRLVYNSFSGAFTGDFFSAYDIANTNSADCRVLTSFVVQKADTIASLGVLFGGRAGTPNIQYTLFAADEYGVPMGSALATSATNSGGHYSTVVTSNPFSSYLLTPGHYCIIAANVAGTPASNHVPIYVPDINTHCDPSIYTRWTSDNGATWFEVPGATYITIAMTSTGWYGSSACGAYTPGRGKPTWAGLGIYNDGSNNRMVGFGHFPTEKRVIHAVRCAPALVGTYASAGNLYARIYRGTTLLGTSNAWKRSDIPATGTAAARAVYRIQRLVFQQPVVVNPDEEIYIVLGSDGGTSSHYWRASTITPCGQAMASNPKTIIDAGGYMPFDKAFPVKSLTGLTPTWANNNGGSDAIALQYEYNIAPWSMR